jgi:hypothetical protein
VTARRRLADQARGSWSRAYDRWDKAYRANKRAGFLAAVRNETPIMSRQADAVYQAAISVDDPGCAPSTSSSRTGISVKRRPSNCSTLTSSAPTTLTLRVRCGGSTGSAPGDRRSLRIFRTTSSVGSAPTRSGTSTPADSRTAASQTAPHLPHQAAASGLHRSSAEVYPSQSRSASLLEHRRSASGQREAAEAKRSTESPCTRAEPRVLHLVPRASRYVMSCHARGSGNAAGGGGAA